MNGPNDRCEPFLERLSAYIDGELPPDDLREVEGHLSSCSRCRALLDELKAADSLVRMELDAESIDGERGERAVAGTLERLREEPDPAWAGRKRRHALTRRWALALRWSAGLAVAAAAVLFVLRIGPIPTAPARHAGPKVRDEVAVQKQKTVEVAAEPGQPAQSRLQEPAQSAPQAARPPESAVAQQDQERMKVAAPEQPEPAVAEEEKPERPNLTVHPYSGPAPAAPNAEPEQAGGGERASPEYRTLGGGAAGEREAGSAGTALRDERARDVALAQRGGADIHRTFAAEPSTGSKGMVTPLDSDHALPLIAPEETLGTASGLAERLERESEVLTHTPQEMLGPEQRAKRWRMIGDLWEWLGRRDNSAVACARALEAYRLALLADPQAAALDSTRVRRARAGAAPESPGNIAPTNR